jgi:hypothetical protein
MLNRFKGIAKTKFGRGDTILFWHDLWNGQVLKISFPHLHSFAKNDAITISSVLQMESFEDHFNLPLSEIAFEQFCELTVLLQSLPENDQNDKWSYIWGSGSYSVSKAYNHLMGQEYVHHAFKWIWRSRCQMKHKVFFDYYYRIG